MFLASRAPRLGAAAAGLGLFAASLLGGCGGGQREGGSQAPGDGARAALVDVQGRPAGTVSVRPVEGKVALDVRVNRLKPGFHGFHVHESGVCDPNAREGGRRMPFASAGAHYARGNAPHGEHAGDLPPLVVGEDGRASYTGVTGGFGIDELLAEDGSAFVVHADPDNLANIPARYVARPRREGGPDAETLEAGDSGNRVACGKVASN